MATKNGKHRSKANKQTNRRPESTKPPIPPAPLIVSHPASETGFLATISLKSNYKDVVVGLCSAFVVASVGIVSSCIAAERARTERIDELRTEYELLELDRNSPQEVQFQARRLIRSIQVRIDRHPDAITSAWIKAKELERQRLESDSINQLEDFRLALQHFNKITDYLAERKDSTQDTPSLEEEIEQSATTLISAAENLPAAAEEYFAHCESGTSCFRLGRSLQHSGQLERAIPILSRACEEFKHNDACTVLGSSHFHGRGTPRNYSKAAWYWQMACDDGEAIACSNLGDAYLRGNGVPKDRESGLRHLRFACDNGNADACATGCKADPPSFCP